MDRHPAPEAGDDRVPMTFEERNTWLYAILVPVTSLAYFGVVVPRLFERPASEVSWAVPMLWAVGATVVGTVVGSIVLAVAARDAEAASDVRDKEIERHGDRIAQAITAFGAAAVLALAMLEVDHFWIGNALFLIGAVGATWGSVAKIRAYRGAFHG
ncbi:hypothetical protein HS048_05175 [Planomonospora sp. ID91781]|uniref:hypothetical protein n=1 Tax=Planomonospora sp. ID91781 TaxID=2738135 RepID=UPI0018C40B59|nr:hypothetical protein [Planomonospora sp. ID91781]MBG0820127.1 hypothetical protein [Planomonospora sp. ID91781]